MLLSEEFHYVEEGGTLNRDSHKVEEGIDSEETHKSVSELWESSC